MQQFTDARGDVWKFSITAYEVQQVRRHLDQNLMEYIAPEAEPGENPEQPFGPLLFRHAQHPEEMAAALFIICEEDASKRGLDERGFMERMAGDAIDEALQALVRAIVDFVPSQKRREILLAVFKKANEVTEKQLDMTHLKVTSGQMEKEMDEEVSRLLSGSTDSSSSAAGSVV